MVATRGRQELMAVPVTVALFTSPRELLLLLLGRVQILIDGDDVVARRLSPLLPNVPFMDLDRQFLDVVHVQIGDRLLALAFGQLG